MSGQRSSIKWAPPCSNSWVSTFMVKFTLMQTGAFRTFVQQCLSNNEHLGNDDVCHLHGQDQAERRRRRRRWRPRRRTGREQRIIKNEARDESERDHESPLARAIGWARLARIHFYTVTCVYLYILFKYLLIELVSYEASSLAYLDCLVVGRFRFIGRTNMISGEMACVLMSVFLVYRWTIHLYMPKFKFYALEFMLYQREQVAQQTKLEFERDRSSICRPDSQQQQQQTVIAPSPGPSSYEHLLRPVKNNLNGRPCPTVTRSCREGSHASPARVSSIFYLRCHFELSETPTWILRPNRTEANWHKLNLWTKVMFYWAISTVITWTVTMYWALAGSVLTELGFEISYPACVAWLRDLQTAAATVADSRQSPANHSTDYSHIYRAPKVLAHELRIDDIPARIAVDTSSFQQASSYYIARVVIDTLENHLIYLEFILQFVGQFYVLVIHSLDIVINAVEIQRRLARLLVELEGRARLDQLQAEYYSKLIEAQDNVGRYTPLSPHRQDRLVINTLPRPPDSVKWLPPTSVDLPYGDCLRSDPVLMGNGKPCQKQQTSIRSTLSYDQLGKEIADLQAILADHYDTLTLGYNLYISFFVTFLLVIWASCTVVVCTWMSAIESRAIEFEFMLIEIGGTLFTLTFLSSVACVKAQNVRLYPLVARAMALDPDWSLTKPRWITILNYYSPRSLYCFTIFGFTELSWLLCLKLISWTLSAFIVLANFYYMNRS